MPKNHEEDSITVDNGDGDVTLEGQSLAHEEERNVFDASQQEASVNQEEGSAEMHFVESKEDMFVDAPDELNVDSREAVMAANGAEVQNDSQENLDMKESQSGEMENGGVDDDIMNELGRLRATLEKTINEKQRLEKEYQEDTEALAKEVVDLRHQIKTMTDERQLLTGKDEERTSVIGVSLHDMISDCSKFLEIVKQEQLQSETMMRELQDVLCAKNGEIEDLNAKVTEFTLSHTVASYYLNSVVEAESDARLENNQHLENVADRMLIYLRNTS
ncbi:uncharacterized protein LOC110811610 [Carica papaya]|uniref:uncharacterized protein LOC110811610 n=1 Tax=Carica papaya TaxID=3649 RepID=UPI000B8CB125|nr:uncharacterized protein LOC110811610 [Carica papaya]